MQKMVEKSRLRLVLRMLDLWRPPDGCAAFTNTDPCIVFDYIPFIGQSKGRNSYFSNKIISQPSYFHHHIPTSSLSDGISSMRLCRTSPVKTQRLSPVCKTLSNRLTGGMSSHLSVCNDVIKPERDERLTSAVI